MEIKKLIESVIHSLTNGDSISNIMLKAQAIAHGLGNEELKKWIKLEQRGYGEKDEIPEYRKIVCGVTVKIFTPFLGEKEISIPPDTVPNNTINERLQFIAIKQSLKEIESLIKSKGENHIFRMGIPAYVFKFFKPIFQANTSIQDAWQYSEISSLESIIDNVKSILLEFFQELDSKIDFTLLDNTQKINKIMNQTINAGIINTGSGNIDVNNSTVIGGSQNTTTISDDLKCQIENILGQIEEIKSNLAADETDIAQYIYEIRQELNKENPSGGFIKKSLRALKSFGNIAASKAVEFGLDKLIALIPS